MRARIEKLSLDFQHETFDLIADDVARQVVAACLLVFYRRGLSKKYVQTYFRDLKSILETPEIFGQVLKSRDVMKVVADAYGIDFKEIKTNKETKTEFRKRPYDG